MKRSKAAAVFALLPLCAGLLAGCGGGALAPSSAAMPPAQAGAEAARPVVLMTTQTLAEGHDDYIRSIADATGLQVEVTAMPINPNDRLAKISAVLSSGDPAFDLFTINDEMLSTFKTLGYLEPLEDTVMVPEVAAQFPQDYLHTMNYYGGSIYGVPMHTEMLAFYVNQELLDRFGLAQVEDQDDFMALMERCKAAGLYGYGGAWDKSYVFNELGTFVNLFGGDVLDWENPDTREAAEFLRMLADEGYTPLAQLTHRYESLAEVFAGGGYACCLLYGVRDQFLTDGTYGPDQFHIAPMPTFRTSTAYFATWHYVLSAGSGNKANALTVLEYLASMPGQLAEAESINRMPARTDALYALDPQTPGLADLKGYLDNTTLLARPLPAESMTYVDALGAAFQRYVLHETDLETFCGQAQQLVDQYFN